MPSTLRSLVFGQTSLQLLTPPCTSDDVATTASDAYTTLPTTSKKKDFSPPSPYTGDLSAYQSTDVISPGYVPVDRSHNTTSRFFSQRAVSSTTESPGVLVQRNAFDTKSLFVSPMKRARASDRENITTDDDPYQQDAPLPSHKRRKLSFDSTVQYRTIYNASSRDPRNQREPFSKAASVVPSPTKAPLSHRTLEPERSSSISRRRSSLSSKASRSVSRKPVSKGRDSLSSSSCEPKPEQQKITFTLPPAETPEAYAQKRIVHLIRREHRSRFADGLQRVISDAEDLDEIEHEETIFGLNPDLRKEVVHWILDVSAFPRLCYK